MFYKFPSGQATTFPRKARVESDFLDSAPKKDEYRSALVDFSLEVVSNS